MQKKRCIGGMLHRLDLLMCFHLRAADGELIPPSQARMLEFIQKSDGCTQSELAEEMGVSPASVAQSLKRMEGAGFIVRDACKGNLRANSLHITDAGSAAALRCRSTLDELEMRMLRDFTDDERKKLNRLLARMIDNLESDGTDSMNNMELSKLLKADTKRKGENDA